MGQRDELQAPAWNADADATVAPSPELQSLALWQAWAAGANIPSVQMQGSVAPQEPPHGSNLLEEEPARVAAARVGDTAATNMSGGTHTAASEMRGSSGGASHLAEQLSSQHLGTSPSSSGLQTAPVTRAARRQANNLTCTGNVSSPTVVSPGSGGGGASNKRARALPDELTFEEYETQYGPSARCMTGSCADVFSQPCKLHTCQACKKNRKLEMRQGARARGYCGMCSRREVVRGLEFVRCCYEYHGDGGQRTRCGVEMLREVYGNHWKQHKDAGQHMFETIDTDEGRICRACTNMRPMTYYPNAETNCSCNNCQTIKLKPGRGLGSQLGLHSGQTFSVSPLQLQSVAAAAATSSRAGSADDALAAAMMSDAPGSSNAASGQAVPPARTSSVSHPGSLPQLPKGPSNIRRAITYPGQLGAPPRGQQAPVGTFPDQDTLEFDLPEDLEDVLVSVGSLLLPGASMGLTDADGQERRMYSPAAQAGSAPVTQAAAAAQHSNGATAATASNQPSPSYPAPQGLPIGQGVQLQQPNPSALTQHITNQVLAHLSRARAEVVCAYGICRTLRLHAPTEESVQQVLDACQQVQSVAQAVQAAAAQTDTL